MGKLCSLNSESALIQVHSYLWIDNAQLRVYLSTFVYVFTDLQVSNII